MSIPASAKSKFLILASEITLIILFAIGLYLARTDNPHIRKGPESIPDFGPLPFEVHSSKDEMNESGRAKDSRSFFLKVSAVRESNGLELKGEMELINSGQQPLGFEYHRAYQPWFNTTIHVVDQSGTTICQVPFSHLASLFYEPEHFSIPPGSKYSTPLPLSSVLWELRDLGVKPGNYKIYGTFKCDDGILKSNETEFSLSDEWLKSKE